MDLFFKQDPNSTATKTACSKLSNNAALVINELSREPAQGLLHVVAHVQKSIPMLLDTHHQLEAAATQLQAVLTELQDAQEGITSITSPATQQDLASLAASVDKMHNVLDARKTHLLQQQQQGQQGGSSVTGDVAALLGSSASSSSCLRKLFGSTTTS